MGYTQGFDAKITIGSAPLDISTHGRVVEWTEDDANNNKTGFGRTQHRSRKGIKTTTFRYEGLVDAASLKDLIQQKDIEAVPVTVEIGAVGGSDPAGTYTGTFNTTRWSLGSQVEGEWAFQLSMTNADDVTYTPPGP